jgi:hypothetical protein
MALEGSEGNVGRVNAGMRAIHEAGPSMIARACTHWCVTVLEKPKKRHQFIEFRYLKNGSVKMPVSDVLATATFWAIVVGTPIWRRSSARSGRIFVGRSKATPRAVHGILSLTIVSQPAGKRQSR